MGTGTNPKQILQIRIYIPHCIQILWICDATASQTEKINLKVNKTTTSRVEEQEQTFICGAF